MKPLPRLAFLIVILSLTSCVEPLGEGVKIKFEIDRPSKTKSKDSKERTTFPPSDPLDLNCFALNVSGSGINHSFDGTPIQEATKCLGFEKVSNLVTRSELESNGIEMQVRAGFNRRIQLIGLGFPFVSGCGGAKTIQDVKATPYVYVLGEQFVDLSSNTTIELNNIYTTNSKDITQNCSHAFSRNLRPVVAYQSAFDDNLASSFFEPLSDTSTLPPTLASAYATIVSPLSISLPIAKETLFTQKGDIASSLNGKGHLKLDFFFAAVGIDLSSQTSLKVKGKMKGGSSLNGTFCDSTLQAGSNTLSLAIWNNTDNAWEVLGQPTEEHFDYSASETDLTKYKVTRSGALGTQDFFHVAFVETTGHTADPAKPMCSSIRYDNLELVLGDVGKTLPKADTYR